MGGDQFQNIMFVLGMDAEMVAAALQESYNNVIRRLPQYSTHPPVGWKFMDKFIQLPFVIPPTEQKDLDMYITTLERLEKIDRF
jgi:hypothetical protein